MTRAEDAPGCVFCIARTIGEGRQLIVHEGALAYVILNKFPYNSGHLMVVPHRHIAHLAGLEDSELSEMAKLTQLSERVLTEAYSPQGINVGMNLGPSRRRGDRRPPAYAPGAAVERRHEFHDGGRRSQGPSGRIAEDRGTAAADLPKAFLIPIA